jgi:hypothetical protein
MEAAENSSWDLANICFGKQPDFFKADISLAVLLVNLFHDWYTLSCMSTVGASYKSIAEKPTDFGSKIRR